MYRDLFYDAEQKALVTTHVTLVPNITAEEFFTLVNYHGELEKKLTELQGIKNEHESAL
jgi:hypothetical protein